jgi:hypothetical protein
MVTVLGALVEYPSQTVSWTLYVPVLSATNVGFAVLPLLSVAVLPEGFERNDH